MTRSIYGADAVPRLSEDARDSKALGQRIMRRLRAVFSVQLAPEPVNYSLAPHRPSRWFVAHTFTDPHWQGRPGEMGVYKLGYPGHNADVPGGAHASLTPESVRRNIARGTYLPTQTWFDGLPSAAPRQ